ncbi:MAG TPA: 1-deoxy-D-xylulose-5-phosphate reductoisomerase [Planctomycetota bacterium]|nr:1-deoxy-D-xylulose-5-phosphate reductoisomerase [Planctomycetota bacterium]
MKHIAVLGSTGSIGVNALSVLSHLPGYRVAGLAAGSNFDLLARQAVQFGAEAVAVADDTSLSRLRSKLPAGIRVLGGVAGIEAIASLPDADIVVVAISGSAGLPATLAALNAGKTVALANKESLVMAGGLVSQLARRKGLPLLPVDSEHSAIFQALAAGNRGEVRKVIITASGGPLRDVPLDELDLVTPERALQHPTWSMGRKITIDSATMMNKALEIVEARWLFGLDASQIEVLIHPQSIVHSMVVFCDGSVIAQMGAPDMRVPIQYALTYPNRQPGPVSEPDFAAIGRLDFLAPDPERYPALELGYRAAREDGTLGAVLNAANEVAVADFLHGRIPFTRITEIVREVMDLHDVIKQPDLPQILEADRWARQVCSEGRRLGKA